MGVSNMLYGPSAATGVAGGASVLLATGDPVYAVLAGFTLLGAVLASVRIAPAIRRRRAARRG